MQPGGPARKALLVVTGALLIGALVVPALDGFLAISFSDKVPLTGAPREGSAASEALGATTVALDVPPPGDPLVDLAVDRLRTALTDAGVGLVDDPAAPDGLTARLDPAAAGGATSPEAYDLAREAGRVELAAPDRRGLAAGLFQLADHVDAGSAWRGLEPGPRTVAPALERRFVDTGAVGIAPDPQAWAAQDDYVHASGALGEVVLRGPPWLDPEELAAVDAEWRAYVDRMVSYGYDGVVVPGFLEYVTFDGLDDGTGAVYPPGSPYRERALAMREQVGAMWAYADTMGMDVVMVTDMLALTEPLEEHLRGLPGGLDTGDPALWDVYRAGADELLTELPFVDGIMIRVGEAGAIYNLEGWDYYSALEVTEADQLEAMVRTFTDVAAEHDADVYLRSWSVGVGGVGDLHTSPETYQQVLGDLGPEQGVGNLVVSTKFVAGDFDGWLPLNPTLLDGPQDRLVEIQARREFEGFGAFPNDTTAEHAAALQAVDRANPGLDGVWVWTQSGGPQRAGPMSLYLTTGDWRLWDLQVWTSARLAWDPDADLDTMERTWLRRTWSRDPATVAGLSQLLALSRQAVLDGLYVGPYAEQEVRAFGLEPPPMLWIFKWDLVGGDSATWSALYEASRGRVDEAVDGGDRAVSQVERMQALLAGLDPAAFTDPDQHARLTASLAYEHDLFLTLGAYRETMLRGQQWLVTGDPDAREQQLAAAERYRSLVAAHRERWTGDLDHPPYSFAAADTGLARLDGQTPGRWLAAGMLLLAAAGLLAVPLLRRAAVAPWRLTPQVWGAAPAWQRVGALVVPLSVVVGAHVAFAALVAPAYVALAVTTGLLATAVAALTGRVAVDRLTSPARAGRGRWALWAAVVAGPQLVGVLPLLAATAWRGPVGAWSGFWLDPASRAVYVVAATVALVWVLVAPALTGVGRSARGRASVALAAAGGALVWLGGLTQAVGQERLLTLLNDQLQVVPGGLSRILGLTVHLGVPERLPVLVLAAGGAAWALAAVLLAGLRLSGGRVSLPRQPAAPSAVSARSNHSAST